MGAKTWMLVYDDGNAPEKLGHHPALDREATDQLVTKLFPRDHLAAIEDGNLAYTNPPDDVIYAGCFDGVSVIAAKEFTGTYPSKLDKRFIENAETKFIYLHAMHSVVDWFAFAKWESGQLIRSLSLAPDDGIFEDIGEKLPFERPFWEGQHPEDDDYPLPFHPLELAEQALKTFFGYQLEGYIDDSLFDPEQVLLVGYRRHKKRWWKFWSA